MSEVSIEHTTSRCKCICLQPTKQCHSEGHRNRILEHTQVIDSEESSIQGDIGSRWDVLHKDLLGQILPRISVDNLMRTRLVCKEWDSYIKSRSFVNLCRELWPLQEPPWLFAVSPYNCRDCCCAYNPTLEIWYSMPLLFLPQSIRFPVAAIGGLLVIKGSSSKSQHLAVCNPITKQWKHLPPMHHPRWNSILGVIENRSTTTTATNNFQIIVAGGRSERGNGYEPAMEIYDSCTNSWQEIGEVPSKYTVRLTLWTPNDTVYCNGIMYCLTSARPYSIIAFDLIKGVWSEVLVPRPEDLLCSFLVRIRGKLILVGGVGSPRNCKCLNFWELQGHGSGQPRWLEIETMPVELFSRFFRGKSDFDYKCAGSGNLLYFFKDSHSEMLVCELSANHRTTWRWMPSCCSVRQQSSKFSIRGMFIHPRLDASIG